MKNIKNFILRWFYSTNHKDIGTLYILYGALAGIVGSLFSVFKKIELFYKKYYSIIIQKRLWFILIIMNQLGFFFTLFLIYFDLNLFYIINNIFVLLNISCFQFFNMNLLNLILFLFILVIAIKQILLIKINYKFIMYNLSLLIKKLLIILLLLILSLDLFSLIINYEIYYFFIMFVWTNITWKLFLKINFIVLFPIVMKFLLKKKYGKKILKIKIFIFEKRIIKLFLGLLGFLIYFFYSSTENNSYAMDRGSGNNIDGGGNNPGGNRDIGWTSWLDGILRPNTFLYTTLILLIAAGISGWAYLHSSAAEKEICNLLTAGIALELSLYENIIELGFSNDQIVAFARLIAVWALHNRKLLNRSNIFIPYALNFDDAEYTEWTTSDSLKIIITCYNFYNKINLR